MIYKLSGLAILAASFLVLLVGIALMIGRHENDSLLFRVLGAGLVLGTGTVLSLTVRRWAAISSPFASLRLPKRYSPLFSALRFQLRTW